MSVFGYIRASTNDQKDTLTGQENQIKKYCELKSLELKTLYIDGGVSGSIDLKARPQGGEMMKNIVKGDTLIVCKLDRISRNVADFVNTLNYFNKNNIAFHCLEPQIDTSNPFGLFMCQVLSSISELERSMTIERVKKTIQVRKDKKMCVGSIPYGYVKKNKDEPLQEDKDEQDNIRRILLFYSKDKMNKKEIANKMNELDIKNRKDKKWYPEQIKRIITRWNK